MALNAARCFSYDHREIHKLEQEVKKKLNVLRMVTELKDFNYETPQMYYDKATGEIKMKEKEDDQKKTVIKNFDEFEREKKALYAEVGLEEDGKTPKEEATSE